MAKLSKSAVERERFRAALEAIAYDPHCVYPEVRGDYETGVVDGHRCAATKAREALAGTLAPDAKILGTLGFVLDLGLRETIGAVKYCPDHGDAKVKAVIWNKRRGWCANCNPFTLLFGKKRGESEQKGGE